MRCGYGEYTQRQESNRFVENQPETNFHPTIIECLTYLTILLYPAINFIIS